MGILGKRRLEKCPRSKDLLHYWPELIEGMRFSTQEFYERTEAALQARQIPQLEVCRVDIKEGGPLTPRREYLRLRRERLVFDICAMPFGTGFYVSEWFWKQPRRIGLIFLLLVMAMAAIGFTVWTYPVHILWFFYRTFGRHRDEVMRMVLGLAIVAALWFGDAMDGMLMRMPVVGYFYERYFRRITYYREDRTHAFQAAAHSALCSVINEICQAQGIAPLTDAAKRPMHPQVKPKVGPLRRKPSSMNDDAGPAPELQPVG
jgi:hypothetical protein